MITVLFPVNSWPPDVRAEDFLLLKESQDYRIFHFAQYELKVSTNDAELPEMKRRLLCFTTSAGIFRVAITHERSIGDSLSINTTVYIVGILSMQWITRYH
jgi:hypothetical protein